MLSTEDKAQGTIKSWSEYLLNKFPYWKLVRITAYMKRFINSCRKVHRDGPITKSEVVGAEEIWIRITQETSDMTSTLRLAKDEVGILRCNERIQGHTSIFIPRKSALARSIIEHCHLQTLHAWGSRDNNEQGATKILDSQVASTVVGWILRKIDWHHEEHPFQSNWKSPFDFRRSFIGRGVSSKQPTSLLPG